MAAARDLGRRRSRGLGECNAAVIRNLSMIIPVPVIFARNTVSVIDSFKFKAKPALLQRASNWNHKYRVARQRTKGPK
jgi:hypothetical protein